MRLRHHKESAWNHSTMDARFQTPEVSTYSLENKLTEAERIACRMLERPERQPRPRPTMRRFSWEDAGRSGATITDADDATRSAPARSEGTD